jgi:hypothetical protein
MPKKEKPTLSENLQVLYLPDEILESTRASSMPPLTLFYHMAKKRLVYRTYTTRPSIKIFLARLGNRRRVVVGKQIIWISVFTISSILIWLAEWKLSLENEPPMFFLPHCTTNNCHRHLCDSSFLALLTFIHQSQVAVLDCTYRCNVPLFDCSTLDSQSNTTPRRNDYFLVITYP